MSTTPTTADGIEIKVGMTLYSPRGTVYVCCNVEVKEEVKLTHTETETIAWIKYENATPGKFTVFKAWLPSIYASKEQAAKHGKEPPCSDQQD